MSVCFVNSMGRKKEEFKALKEDEVGMYTCGPTVYNFATIGNFRAYIFEDLLRRTLKCHGYKVTQVMNLTDVDDKTIRDSQAAGIPLQTYTEKFKKAFFEDLETLNIEKAEFYPAATDHVQEMIELIKVLIEKEYAYQAEDGSVYYSIAKFANYGKLARIDMDNQKVGERISADEYAKDSVADFALWKAWDENDGEIKWDSPWGEGRPGWHIECSAMSMKYLGKTFDIHTGGVDNMFPHHEDEIAQSEAANDCRYVNYWLHCDHLIVNGEKMSKSLGNFYTLRDVLDKGYNGCELRWVLISTHYRKKLNFTWEECDNARTTLKKLRNLFARLREVNGNGEDDSKAEGLSKKVQKMFKDALGDDLNISEALAAVFGLEHEANKMIESGTLSQKGTEAILQQFRNFDQVLGCLQVDQTDDEVPAEIQQMAEKRQQARKDKDFTTADTIRDELLKQGWEIEDTAQGPRVKKM